MDEPRSAIAKEAERLEENCEYSGQRHFETRTFWGRFRDALGFLLTLSSATAAVNAFASVFGEWVTGTAAAVATVLSVIVSYFSPGRRAAEHGATGEAYLAMQGRLRRFRTITVPHGDLDVGALDERLNDLASQLDTLNASSPSTPPWAYRAARNNIRRGQTSFRADTARAAPKDA